MKLSLRVKLTAAFIIMTLFLFVVVGIMANLLLERQFKEYVIDKQDQKNTDIVSLITSRYKDWGGKWDIGGIESIGVNLLSEGLLLRVRDAYGSVVWDAAVHNNGMCTMMIAHMAQNMQNQNPNFVGAYTERTFAVRENGAEAGSIDIGYYGPYFYSDNDIKYLAALNKLLLFAAAICALLALLLGIYMAKRLSSPIYKVIQSAQKIAEGEYGDRVRQTSNTTEMVELTNTINSLADSLRKQEMLRKRLTADVAHELRTPLATLQSHLEAMIDGIWKAEPERLKSCHEETVRLSKMVGDLEELSKFDGDHLVLFKEEFDLSAMLKRIALNFEMPFKTKGVKLSLQVDAQIICADEDKISQVFINLLSNALKYTEEDGLVEIRSLAQTKDWAKVSVRDTGIGICEEDFPHIFERFYRTDQSRNRMTGGSGIGLAIAKAIVDAHGGTIAAQSERNKGSLFIVSLPL